MGMASICQRPQLAVARREQLHVETGEGDFLGVGTLAQIARAAERLEVRHGGRAALAPGHHMIAMHQVERDGPAAVVAHPVLALPGPPDLVRLNMRRGSRSTSVPYREVRCPCPAAWFHSRTQSSMEVCLATSVA